MTQALAFAYAGLAALPVLMHLANAAGAPLGRFTVGGRFPGRLPPVWRALARVQAALLGTMAGAVLARDGIGVLSLTALFWPAVALTLLSLAANAASPRAQSACSGRQSSFPWPPPRSAWACPEPRSRSMNVLVAGATGYLGRFLCAEYARRGHHVTALVRDARRAGTLADLTVEAEATRPDTLKGIIDGTELVVSSLGITRQADGLATGTSTIRPSSTCCARRRLRA
ncbi:NAD(P)H-binding protein [Palleronia abyssalis]|uniref:NAD(P)-binding domain-containing protein n=1 Tax=Palleronia abyssalis TaxID=1501240 RepID=A0A2R8BWS9_9RHOB|nr:NAD(P)H-binding protein [Palleronia abyssalis]SPJ24605.1 hypothetical protein PAA8504_02441 [Palleronia abyssalis]